MGKFAAHSVWFHSGFWDIRIRQKTLCRCWHRLYVRTQSTFNVIQEANCSLRADQCHGNELLLCEWRILFMKKQTSAQVLLFQVKKKTASQNAATKLRITFPSNPSTFMHICKENKYTSSKYVFFCSFLKLAALVSVTNILFCASVKIPETRQLKGTLYQSGVFKRPPSVLRGWGDKTGS